MIYHVSCQTCGRVFALGRLEAGERVMCPACGAVSENPLLSFPLQQPQQHGPATLADRAHDDAEAQDRGLYPGGPRRRWVVVAVALTAALIGAMAAVLSTRAGKSTADAGRSQWEDSHRLELMELKSRAEEMTLRGDLSGAWRIYRQLGETAAGHEIWDAQLKENLEQARFDQDRVYSVLMARQGRAVSGTNPPR